MKYYKCNTNLKFRWDQVGNGIFQRYPNPWSKHILSEDVISRKVEGPILKTIRVIGKTNKLPMVGHALVSSTSGFVVEESFVNRDEKTAVTYTRNLSFANVMACEERCQYTVSPDSKNWTLLKRESWIVSNFHSLSRAIEVFGMERYKQNIKKSLKGMNYVLSKMYLPEKRSTKLGVSLPKPVSI